MSTTPQASASTPPALGTAATPDRPVEPPAVSRRRAWVLLASVALVTLIYLTGWTLWAVTHTSNRYEQLPPGEAGTRAGAEFRVLSLTRAGQLADSAGRESQVADPGATFVVAHVEVLKVREDEGFLCGVDLLGPDRRVWAPISLLNVQREVPFCQSGSVVVGTPYQFESVFLVPERYADQIGGVALTDNSGAARSQVLRPPA